jgi:hypothetical protein
VRGALCCQVKQQQQLAAGRLQQQRSNGVQGWLQQLLSLDLSAVPEPM